MILLYENKQSPNGSLDGKNYQKSKPKWDDMMNASHNPINFKDILCSPLKAMVKIGILNVYAQSKVKLELPVRLYWKITKILWNENPIWLHFLINKCNPIWLTQNGGTSCWKFHPLSINIPNKCTSNPNRALCFHIWWINPGHCLAVEGPEGPPGLGRSWLIPGEACRPSQGYCPWAVPGCLEGLEGPQAWLLPPGPGWAGWRALRPGCYPWLCLGWKPPSWAGEAWLAPETWLEGPWPWLAAGEGLGAWLALRLAVWLGSPLGVLCLVKPTEMIKLVKLVKMMKLRLLAGKCYFC